MNSTEDRTRVLDHIAARAFPDNIDLWPAVHARSRRQTRVWLAPLAAALVVATAAGLFAWWSQPESVSAETIFDRAQGMAAGATSVQSYHLRMTRQSPAKGVGVTTASEVWYDGQDHQRTEQRTIDAHGALVSSQDVVFNGPDTWSAETNSGQTRVIHTAGTNWTRPADDPSSQGDMADVLARYGAKGCSTVQRRAGEATVAGQQTYVIDVTPGAGGCVTASPEPAHLSGQVQRSEPGVSGLTVWVDTRSFLPLRLEVRDTRGNVVDRSQVTQVEYNVAIPPSTFQYTPPAGVTVATFSGGDGADVKRALYGPPPDKSARPETP